MHFCGYIAHCPPHAETRPPARLSPASLLSPQQPIAPWAWREEQGRGTEAPLPAASLVSRGIETGCLWEGGSFGEASLGPGPRQGCHVPHPSCFWIPAPLWVCVRVCARAYACVGVCVF